MTETVHLGFEVGTGKPVSIPMKHMVVTGQTQEAGKTTALEALIARAQVNAVAFITKRGEGSFTSARIIPPYFREQADWQFVASILEASRGEKLKFERAWIIRASKGARSLADVWRNVKKALETAKGLSGDVYLTLDAYLEAVVPQISRVRWAQKVELAPGISAMDLTALNVEMQHLVIRSTLDWVLNHEEHTVVVVPEAWKFIPQGRGTPVKLGAEAYIRQAAGLHNFLWLDSQDIAGVEKIILKSVPVWILGVQRESNEVKRTLDQIPAGIKKPKPEQVATLGLGEFYVCHGTHITKVYAQPKWMFDSVAIAVAKGQLDVHDALPKESEMDEREARALRDENAELRRRIDELEGLLAGRTVGKQGAKMPADDRGPGLAAEERASGRGVETPPSPSPASSPIKFGDYEEALYQSIKMRLTAEAPMVLKTLAMKPELEVTVKREIVTADGTGWIGRTAQLIAEGWFKLPRKVGETHTELLRRGANGIPARTSEAMKALLQKGFLTLEEQGYREVAGMKVRIVEAA